MGSLSDLFRRYNRILEDAFDLDETNTLVVKNPTKVSEADKAFHRALVTDMGSILNELVAPDRRHDDEYQHVQLPPSLLGRPLGNDEVAPYAPIRTAPTARPGAATPAVARPQPNMNDNTGVGRVTQPRSQAPVAGNAPIPEYKGAVDPTTDYSKSQPRSPEVVQGLYHAFRNAGFSHDGATHLIGETNRENGTNPKLMFGTHSDPHDHETNAGIMSWQGSRRPAMLDYLGKNGALDQKGNMVPNQGTLNAQAQYMAQEMQQRPAMWQQFSDPNANLNKQDATSMMGKFYGWRINDPVYRSSGLNNIDKGYDLANRFIPKQETEAGQPRPMASAPSAQPSQVAANTQNRPASPYMAIGDSLALGVGGHLGNTNYTHGSYNPADVNGLVGRAIQNGDVSGKHIILSGGASNAGGNTGMVNQYYPSMIKNLKDAGASQVTVMGVGPYSHYNNYGYHDAINKAATEGGANYTGPLAGIAPFKGNSVQQQVHPTDYQPILSHIQKNFSGTPTQTASAQPSPTPPSPTTPSPIKPIQTAQATPPQPAPTPATPTPVPQPQSTPSPTPTPPSKPTQIASNESRNYRGRTMISLIRGI